MIREKKEFKFELKSIDDTGTFGGYASVFGEVDSYSDVVERGAFKKSLSEHKSFPLLWSHQTTEPIGVISGREDNTGLAVQGQVALDVQRGREVHALMKLGAVSGLSIGYEAIKSEPDYGIRRLREIRLWEVSPVVFPACDSARIAEVKAADEKNRILCLLEMIRL